MINLAYLEFRLSGGSSNTDPNASLGGALSSHRIQFQSTTALSNITGVVIEYAAGNALGEGNLAFDFDDQTLQWTPNAGVAGEAIDVSEGGKFTLFGGGNNGLLLVTVVPSGLPGSDQDDDVTIANIPNDVFDNVAKAESFAGDLEYRCIYVTNTHMDEAFLDILTYIFANSAPAPIAIGLDPAGTGRGEVLSVVGITRAGSVATAEITAHGLVDGVLLTFVGADQAQYNITAAITVVDPDHVSFAVSGSPATPATGTITASSGVAQTVPNENTAPVGVVFTVPTSSLSALGMGSIAPGLARSIWIRRSVPVRNTVNNPASVALLATQAFF